VSPGQDIVLSNHEVEANHHFCNKLWHMSRLIMLLFKSLSGPQQDEVKGGWEQIDEYESQLGYPERGFLSLLHKLISDTTDRLHKLQIGVGRDIFVFSYDIFAGLYLELSKFKFNENPGADYLVNVMKVVMYGMDRLMRILHPYMPHITEVIHQSLPIPRHFPLINDKWPSVSVSGEDGFKHDEDAVKRLLTLKNLLGHIRGLRAIHQVKNSKLFTQIQVEAATEQICADLRQEQQFIEKMCGIEKDDLRFHIPRHNLAKSQLDRNNSNSMEADRYKYNGTAGSVMSSVLDGHGGLRVSIPKDQLQNSEMQKKRLSKQRQALEKQIQVLERKLSSLDFTEKAPPMKVEEAREKHARKSAEIAEVVRALASL